MRDSIEQLRDMPVVTRCVVLGGTVLGVCGAIVGLVVGLFVYPPTAWFAAIELGFPAAAVGSLLGLLVGATVLTARRVLGRARRAHRLD